MNEYVTYEFHLTKSSQQTFNSSPWKISLLFLLTYLANNTAPAIVDRDAGTIHDAGPFAIRQISTKACHLIQIAHGCFNRFKNRIEFLENVHVHSIPEYIGNIGVHCAHHEGVTLNALIAIEGGRILREADKAVFARCISGS